MKVVVSAGLPTSIKLVALRIAEANNWEFRPNPFAKRDYDYLVYVSDPRLDTYLVGKSFPVDRVVVYLITEGVLRYDLKKVMGKQRVVAPTNFVKDMIEKHDIKVEKVIPHGIEIPKNVKPVSEKKGYFYRAYYLPRKYPDYGLNAFERWVSKRKHYDDIDIYLVGAPYFPQDFKLKARFPFFKIKNPITKKEMAELYDSHRFYLNLSDAEGFGLTPLEAMSYGEIIITAYYPAIRDYLPVDCNIAVGIKDYWLEKIEYEYILHAEYEPENYLKALEISEELTEKELEKMSRCNIETAKKFDYKKVYLEFKKLIDEIAK